MPPGTPFHGFIHPFPIRVDEFDSPASLSGNPALHLLSHTHTDHLVGLSAKSFSSTIICSQDAKEMLLRHEVYTERALQEMKLREAKVGRTFGHLKVSPVVIDGKWYYDGSRDLLRALPTNTLTTIELSDSESATITLIDANHCPGAVMFLVESAKGAVLHTGDFRAETRFVENIAQDKALQPYLSYQGPAGDFTPPLRTLDAIYLDTACQFSESPVPSKKEAVDGLIELMKLVPSTSIFFINAWTWGYEEILKAVGRAFGTKIHVDSYKHGIYTHLSDRAMPLILTQDASSTRFHACERFDRCSQAAESANNDRHVVYVNPVTMSTDKWTVYFSETKAALRAGKRLDCLLVPLSRHSPLPELRAFVSLFRPKRIVPNTLDPQLHGLDWKCMARMYAGCLARDGAMPGVSTDARALELDEAQLGDAALKNVQGPEHALELAMRWAESGAPRKKLEVMERYLTGGERTVVRRCLGLEQEWDLSSGEEEGAKADPAQTKAPPPPEKRPFTTWDKAQLAQRINVCKRQKLWKPESQGSDEETDDDEEGRARMAHFLFAPLAGIEEPYPGGPGFSYETQDEQQEEVIMLEADTVKTPAGDSLPTPSASPLSLRKDKGKGKAVEDVCVENDQLPLPTPPPTAPRQLPISPVASRTLKRKASGAEVHDDTDHTSCRRHSQEDALAEKKNLPEESSHRSQEATTPASDPPHRAKRSRIQEWISSSTIITDTDVFPASPTSSQPPADAELSAMHINENMPQTQPSRSPPSQRHSGRKSSGRNAPFMPNAPVQGASTMLIPSLEPPAFAPSASAETAKATKDKEWRRAVRAKSRILAERLKKACPGSPTPRLGEAFARAQADTHRALAKSKRPLAQASSFESVSNSVDENEMDWERSRRLAEQIREDSARGRTLRVPRLECVENL